MLVKSMSDQPRTDEARLITTNRITIPPHHRAVFHSKPTADVYIDPNTICSTRQNDLLTLKYPEMLILETLHSFNPENMSNDIVIFTYNCGDIDLITPKTTMVAYMKESKFHIADLSWAITMLLIKQGCINTIQTQVSSELGSDSNINHTNIDIDINKGIPEPLNMSLNNLNENEIRQIAEQSAFVHPSTFHPKPRLTLEDAYITPQTKQNLNKLLIDFDDIMSHSSTDIGLVTPEDQKKCQ